MARAKSAKRRKGRTGRVKTGGSKNQLPSVIQTGSNSATFSFFPRVDSFADANKVFILGLRALTLALHEV